MSYIKNKILSAVIILALLFLTSCSPVNRHAIDQTHSENNAGILVISTKNHCNLIGATGVPMYQIRSADNEVDFRVVGDSTTSREFVTECSTLDFYNIPAGEYEIYFWKEAKFTALSYWHEKPKNEFSIKFMVKSNKVNYLGQIVLDEDYSISFVNMEERDIKTFNKKYPALSNLEVVYPVDFNYKLSSYGDILFTQ